MEKEKNMLNEEEVKEMSIADLRKVIMGELEFTFKVNDKVEITFKELTQKQVIEIEKEVAAKGFQPLTPEYNQQTSIVKLAKALKSIKVNGFEYPTIKDVNEIEKLLNDLGEGVVAGLALAYDSEIANKFRQIEKKN